MTRRTTLIAVATAAIVAAGAGVAISSDDDGERQATGPGAERARAAALALYPGGRANSVERDGEDGATWEVEITRKDGKTVDVRLDDAYDLVVAESDREDEDE
jgi:uncharacterized membrane protein YkoI